MKKDTRTKTQIYGIIAVILITIKLFGLITLSELLFGLLTIPVYHFAFHFLASFKIIWKNNRIVKIYNLFNGANFKAEILGEPVSGKIIVLDYGAYLCFNENHKDIGIKNPDKRKYYGYTYRYFIETMKTKELKGAEVTNLRTKKEEK